MRVEPDEKRAHPRVDLKLPLKYRVLAHVGTLEFEKISGQIGRNDTLNVSQSGACFMTSEYIATDTILLLVFNFPSLPDPMKAVARVMWCQPECDGGYKVGVRYLATRPESIEPLIADSAKSINP